MRLVRRKRSNGDSQKAVVEAQEHLEKIKSRNAEVTDLSISIREIRSKNHFADQLYQILGNNLEGRPR